MATATEEGGSKESLYLRIRTRTEAVKLAFDVALRTGKLNQHLSQSETWDMFMQIISLAKMCEEYIGTGDVNWEKL